jgi:diguanylate cyclase (GGDEF)-like protein
VVSRQIFWAGLYVAAALAGRITRPEDSPIALVWPAAGVAVLWVLLSRGNARVVAALGLLAMSSLVNLWTGAPLTSALLLGAANLTHAVVAVVVLERVTPGHQPCLSEVSDLYRLGLAALSGGIASTPFGLIVWAMSDADVPLSVAAGAWILRYSAITAVIVAVPLAWRSGRERFVVSRGRATEAIAVTLVAVVAYPMVFFARELSFAFLVMPIAVWVGVRMGAFYASLHGLLAIVICVTATHLGLGPFGQINNQLERSIIVQAFIAITGLIGLALALTVQDRRRALDNAASGRRELQHVLNSALLGQAVVLIDGEMAGRIHYANPELRRWAGLPDPLPHASWVDLVAEEDIEVARSAMAHLTNGSDEWHGELRMLPGRGTRWCEVSLARLPESAAEGQGRRAYLQILDVTTRRELADRLAHQAMHDELTGLPNRALLRDRLEHALAASSRTQRDVALIFIDIDRFKTINDSLGHEVGDDIIGTVGRRLLDAVRPGDTVARLGGDEFVACCIDLYGPQQAASIADRLVRRVSRPTMIDGNLVQISVSAGVALADPDSDPDELLRNSDMAMYEAKNRGRGRVEFFQQELHDRATRQLELTGQLRDALRRDEFVLHYQPLIDLNSGRVVALEALVRWQHPDRGLMLPGEWLDVAEAHGLIIDIGREILVRAIREAATMTMGTDIRLHVNVSASQLREPGMADQVEKVLHAHAFDPSRLVLELTETQLLSVQVEVLDELNRLRALGVVLSVDDFGTGFSSLSQLTTLPIGELKIDRSFVTHMASDTRSQAVVQGVLGMASAMDLHVVAEGVEDAATEQALRAWGCDVAQGFLWSPAVPPHAVRALVGSYA